MTVIQRARNLSREERRSLRIGLLFISPWVIGFLAFRLIPFLMSFYYSFTFYPVLETPKWIGLDNFIQLFDDPRFLTSLYNTAYYAFFAVPLGALAGISLAMLLNMKVRGMSIWRTIFYLPSITPVVATSLVGRRKPGRSACLWLGR